MTRWTSQVYQPFSCSRSWVFMYHSNHQDMTWRYIIFNHKWYTFYFRSWSWCKIISLIQQYDLNNSDGDIKSVQYFFSRVIYLRELFQHYLQSRLFCHKWEREIRVIQGIFFPFPWELYRILQKVKVLTSFSCF